VKIVVQKYGGSSLSTLAKIDALAASIARREEGQERLVLVVSAMGDTTDQLLRMAHELSHHPPARELDMLLTTGEQVSIALMAMALAKHGADAISFTGAQVGIRTSGHHTRAKVVGVSVEKVLAHLRERRIVIVAGFQGVTEDDSLTTLGRGGSDITAMALAVALAAERLEKYTDRDGVFTADPRLHPDARIIPRISYHEMLEMSHSGAKILHPRAVFFAWKFGVPILVRESLGDGTGTLIQDMEEDVEQAIIRAVTHDANVAKVTIYKVPDRPGVASRVFDELARREIGVDMIVQSTTASATNDISFTVKRPDLAAAVDALQALASDMPGAQVEADATIARISIVGLGIKTETHVAARMFRSLADRGINIQMIATSDVKISCVIPESQVRDAIEAVCKQFGL
jgi:aspartate kinase